MSIRLGKNIFIAGKVNVESLLDSPVFTGTPTTPTPDEGDNSKTLANTEFVQREIESKADSSSVYTKEEVDAKLGNVSVDLSEYYNKEEVDAKLENLDSLPDQTDNANKALVTNGTEASWQYTNIYRDLDDSTEVSSSQIVINTLSKETYDSMKEAGTLVDTELYMINDETPIPTKISELENDVGYITSHIDISGKADKETTYTKEEVDTLFDNYIPDVSTKADITYVDEQLGLKAEKSDTYTKEEVNNLLASIDIPEQSPNIKGGEYIDVKLPEPITVYIHTSYFTPANVGFTSCIDIPLFTNTFDYEPVTQPEFGQVDEPLSEMYMLTVPDTHIQYITPLTKTDGTPYKLYELVYPELLGMIGLTEDTDENKKTLINVLCETNVDPEAPCGVLLVDLNMGEPLIGCIYQDIHGNYIWGMYFSWSYQPISTESVQPIDNSITIDWNDAAIKKFEEIDALPKQQDNAGKYLTTDGTTASWGDIYPAVIRVWE